MLDCIDEYADCDWCADTVHIEDWIIRHEIIDLPTGDTEEHTLILCAKCDQLTGDPS
jgi:hypothetical protein